MIIKQQASFYYLLCYFLSLIKSEEFATPTLLCCISEETPEQEAEYNSCTIASKWNNRSMENEFDMRYRIITSESIKELKFVMPEPKDAIVHNFSVTLAGDKTYESICQPKFVADEQYKETKETETRGTMNTLDGKIVIRLKLAKTKSWLNESVVIKILMETPVGVVNEFGNMCYNYCMELKSFYRYKERESYENSSFINNQHGKCDFKASFYMPNCNIFSYGITDGITEKTEITFQYQIQEMIS